MNRETQGNSVARGAKRHSHICSGACISCCQPQPAAASHIQFCVLRPWTPSRPCGPQSVIPTGNCCAAGPVLHNGCTSAIMVAHDLWTWYQASTRLMWQSVVAIQPHNRGTWSRGCAIVSPICGPHVFGPFSPLGPTIWVAEGPIVYCVPILAAGLG